MDTPGASPAAGSGGNRRGLLASAWFMAGGLVAGYGACAAMGVRYLYPASSSRKAWLFVARTSELAEGGALSFKAPTGARIAIARQGSAGTVDDFVALSSTCPHLGCQVHWEPQNDRFFCPCHNGVFDPGGAPVSGPPADSNQSLPRYPLKVQDGSLFIEVPIERLGGKVARLERVTPPQAGGPGLDPCLDGGAERGRSQWFADRETTA